MLPILVAALLAAPQAPSGDAECRFTLVKDVPEVQIVGPAESVQVTRVLPQPDSPLRIVRVDLASSSFGGTGGGAIGFDVFNASDRPIAGGAVAFTWQVGDTVTSGSAAFTNVLQPSQRMRVDARLPETGAPQRSLYALAVAVRSANVGPCTFEPAQARPRSIFRRDSGFVGKPAAEACAFTATGPAGEPTVIGAPELVARVQLPVQPGSPLRIVGVNLSKLKVNIGDSWLQMRGSYTLQVQNVSDLAIESAVLGLLTMAGAPSGGPGTAWTVPLAPGKTATLKHDVATFVDFQPGATAADVRLMPIVSGVNFPFCSYRPAWLYPTRRP